MWRWLLWISRPFAIALGLFIVINLGFALRGTDLAVTGMWLDLPLPEPWLSAFAGILGLALLVPHAWTARGSLRILQAGVFVGFLALAVSNTLGFYHLVRSEQIHSRALFPFSLFIAVVILLEVARVAFWAPVRLRLPRPARIFFGSLAVVVASFFMILAHIYTYGKIDHSISQTADAVVILGARAYPDGTLSDALRYRMETALELFLDDGKEVRYLIHSGGVDERGLSEPRAMIAWAIEHGVPPERNIPDEGGLNTYRSAVNCAVIAHDMGFERVFVVSQYFHNARVKLVFEREGVPCYTVPARGSLRREAFYLFREAFAYPYYFFFRQ